MRSKAVADLLEAWDMGQFAKDMLPMPEFLRERLFAVLEELTAQSTDSPTASGLPLSAEQIEELQIMLLRLAIKLGSDELEAKFAEFCAQARLAITLREERDALKAAAPLCGKHQPSGGTRGGCVICSGLKLEAAFSRIDYLCGEPNEQGVSNYDLDYNEDRVVERVRAALAQSADAKGGV